MPARTGRSLMPLRPIHFWAFKEAIEVHRESQLVLVGKSWMSWQSVLCTEELLLPPVCLWPLSPPSPPHHHPLHQHHHRCHCFLCTPRFAITTNKALLISLACISVLSSNSVLLLVLQFTLVLPCLLISFHLRLFLLILFFIFLLLLMALRFIHFCFRVLSYFFAHPFSSFLFSASFSSSSFCFLFLPSVFFFFFIADAVLSLPFFIMH